MLVTAAVVSGVSVVGLKTHLAVVGGSPEQDSVTISLKPFSGVTVTVIFAKSPGERLTEVGLAVSAKSGRLVVDPVAAAVDADAA